MLLDNLIYFINLELIYNRNKVNNFIRLLAASKKNFRTKNERRDNSNTYYK